MYINILRLRKVIHDSVCLSVSRQYIKTDASRITKLNIQMFHNESWKPVYFRETGQGHYV